MTETEWPTRTENWLRVSPRYAWVDLVLNLFWVLVTAGGYLVVALVLADEKPPLAVHLIVAAVALVLLGSALLGSVGGPKSVDTYQVIDAIDDNKVTQALLVDPDQTITITLEDGSKQKAQYVQGQGINQNLTSISQVSNETVSGMRLAADAVSGLTERTGELGNLIECLRGEHENDCIASKPRALTAGDRG